MTRSLLLVPALALVLAGCGDAQQLSAGTDGSPTASPSASPSASPPKTDCYPLKRDDKQEEYRQCRVNGGFDNSGATAPWVLRQQAEAAARAAQESTSPPDTTEDEGDPGDTDVDTDVIKDLKIGDGVTVTGEDYEMEVEVLSIKSSTRAIEEYGERPKGLFVGLMVRYTCLSGSCDYNPYDFTLRSDEGDEFDRQLELRARSAVG